MDNCKYTFKFLIKGMKKKDAKKMIQSLSPDNIDIPSDLDISLNFQDDYLEVIVISSNIMRVKNTIDDVFRCILPILNLIKKNNTV